MLSLDGRGAGNGFLDNARRFAHDGRGPLTANAGSNDRNEI